MLDQYSSQNVAESYGKYREKCIFLEHVIVPSVKKLLNNNLSGKRCVDMGCGNGYSTKWLADLDPAEVIGLDQSSAMIDLAKKKFSADPTYAKIKFVCHDCSKPFDEDERFDVVFSSFLLNHASSRDTLDSMVKCMYEATSKEGVCLGVMPSPFLRPNQFSLLHKYGMEKSATIRNDDALEVKVRFYYGDVREGRFQTEVIDYQYEPDVYKQVFTDNGFKNFEWIIPNQCANKSDYFKEFLDINPIILFKAVRL